MTDVQGILVTFLDQTGAKSIKARIAPTVAVSKIIPNIITKMALPITAPDGQPMSYSLDHKEGGKRLQETQTLPDAGVKEGDHLIVYPEIVAGARPKLDSLRQQNLAFSAVVTAEGYSIGLAERGKPGYRPVRAEGPFESYEAARERADEMNADLGLAPKEAWFIVASSMGAQRQKELNR